MVSNICITYFHLTNGIRKSIVNIDDMYSVEVNVGGMFVYIIL